MKIQPGDQTAPSVRSRRGCKRANSTGKKTCAPSLAKGKTKPAVELAREIHKRCGWPESEGLLVGCLCGAHSVPIENRPEGRS